MERLPYLLHLETQVRNEEIALSFTLIVTVFRSPPVPPVHSTEYCLHYIRFGCSGPLLRVKSFVGIWYFWHKTSETRMTASVLKQNPSTWKVKIKIKTLKKWYSLHYVSFSRNASCIISLRFLNTRNRSGHALQFSLAAFLSRKWNAQTNTVFCGWKLAIP